MKTKLVIGITVMAMVATVSAQRVRVGIGIGIGAPAPEPVVVVPAPPPVVVVAPAPVVTVAVGVPDYYAWDGVEFVGVIGTQYVYLGPDDVWIVCDPVRLGRFHDWERVHADWRAHATANVKFRSDANIHAAPMRGDNDAGPDHFKDSDRDRDHGH
jgi:hypothetical protein